MSAQPIEPRPTLNTAQEWVAYYAAQPAKGMDEKKRERLIALFTGR